MFLGALQGAGDGANWAGWTGGRGSHGAWIGAAAGAGVGFLVDVTAGLVKAGSGFSVEPASSPPWRPARAETLVFAEDDTERADPK